MDINKEGTFTSKPLLLNGSNYSYWKVRMIAFLKAIDDQVWEVVVNGFTEPTVVVDGQTRSKPRADWTLDEKNKSNFNNNAIHAIYNGITASEFHRVSVCPTAKAASDLF